MTNKDKLSFFLKKTTEEVKCWAWAAWTLPFVALFALVIEYFIGSEELYQKLIILITVIFFAISVFWWWWALNKIKQLFEVHKKVEDNFNLIIDEIQQTKEAIKDASNWERREP